CDSGDDLTQAMWPLVVQGIASQRRTVGVAMGAVPFDGSSAAEIVMADHQIVGNAGPLGRTERVEQRMKFDQVQEAAGFEQVPYLLRPCCQIWQVAQRTLARVGDVE